MGACESYCFRLTSGRDFLFQKVMRNAGAELLGLYFYRRLKEAEAMAGDSRVRAPVQHLCSRSAEAGVPGQDQITDSFVLVTAARHAGSDAEFFDLKEEPVV